MPKGMVCEDCGLTMPIDNPFWKKRCNDCYHSHRKELGAKKCIKCSEEFVGEHWKKMCGKCFRIGKQAGKDEKVVLVRKREEAPSVKFGFF